MPRPAPESPRGLSDGSLLAELKAALIRWRTPMLVGSNLSLALVAYLSAFALRFDLAIPAQYYSVLLTALPFLLVSKGLGFWIMGLHSGWWRHLSIADVGDIVRGNVLGSLLFLGSMASFVGFQGFPLSVFLIDLVLCTTGMAAVRLSLRMLHEYRENPGPADEADAALIVGAGSAGIRLRDEIEHQALSQTLVARRS